MGFMDTTIIQTWKSEHQLYNKAKIGYSNRKSGTGYI